MGHRPRSRDPSQCQSSVRARNRAPGALRPSAAIILFKRFGEMPPESAHHSQRSLLRWDLLTWNSGPSSDVPSDREKGPVGSQGGQPVVQVPVRDVSPKFRVPAVRRVEGDGRSVPLPALLGVGQVLEHHAPAAARDDLSLVSSLFEGRILGREIGEPIENVRQRSAKLYSDFVQWRRPLRQGPTPAAVIREDSRGVNTLAGYRTVPTTVAPSIGPGVLRWGSSSVRGKAGRRGTALSQSAPVSENVAMYLLQAEEEDKLPQRLEASSNPNLGRAGHYDPRARRDEVKGIDDILDVFLETHVGPLETEGQAPFGLPFEDPLVDHTLVRDALSLATDATVAIGHPALYRLGYPEFEQ